VCIRRRRATPRRTETSPAAMESMTAGEGKSQVKERV
jgi:hypothetical protein